MRIVFEELTIKDFKGFRDFHITFTDGLNSFFGDNGSGKTTVLDSLYYVFFGKNSQNKKKFDIKPLDENNVEIAGTIPTVILSFKKDDVSITIERRGNKYIIDGKPKKATEYSKFIESIISEKMFMTMISPTFFGDNYKWIEQKDIILNNFTVENTLLDNEKYASVKEDIEVDSIEDCKAKYNLQVDTKTEEISATNGKLTYIKEQLKGKKVDSKKEDLIIQRDSLVEQISSLESALLKINPLTEKLATLRIEKSKEQNKHSAIVSDLELQKRSIEKEKSNLTIKYKELQSKLNNVEKVCPTCGNALNEKSIKFTTDSINSEIRDVIQKGKAKGIEINNLQSKLLDTKNTLTDTFDVEIVNLENQIQKVKQEVDSDKINLLKVEKANLDTIILEYDNINKLISDELELTNKLKGDISTKEDSEINLNLVKLYHKEYSELVANALNDKFESVKITTFTTQKNGEVKETFEITKDGVPYSSLNSAGKIIAGVELIRLLNSLLYIELPIVIDNKESITKDFNIKNQMITLAVKEGAELGV